MFSLFFKIHVIYKIPSIVGMDKTIKSMHAGPVQY